MCPWVRFRGVHSRRWLDALYPTHSAKRNPGALSVDGGPRGPVWNAWAQSRWVTGSEPIVGWDSWSGPVILTPADRPRLSSSSRERRPRERCWRRGFRAPAAALVFTVRLCLTLTLCLDTTSTRSTVTQHLKRRLEAVSASSPASPTWIVPLRSFVTSVLLFKAPGGERNLLSPQPTPH